MIESQQAAGIFFQCITASKAFAGAFAKFPSLYAIQGLP